MWFCLEIYGETARARTRVRVVLDPGPGEIDAAAAQVAAGDDRTADQRRADLLIDAILTDPTDRDQPTSHGTRPTIHVTVGPDTLTRAADEPGWLDGYGPITAEHARQLAADPTGTWRRLILDPIFGTVIDYGASRYRPPKALTDLVIARHGACIFPTCNRAAAKSDLDHTTPFHTARPH